MGTTRITNVRIYREDDVWCLKWVEDGIFDVGYLFDTQEEADRARDEVMASGLVIDQKGHLKCS